MYTNPTTKTYAEPEEDEKSLELQVKELNEKLNNAVEKINYLENQITEMKQKMEYMGVFGGLPGFMK
jgi:peptidoglycan hydrolase CwlO-like protein